MASISLDHIIIRRRQLRSLKQCRIMQSVDCKTDHVLVRCKLQFTPKKFYKTRPKPLPLVDVRSAQLSLQSAFSTAAIFQTGQYKLTC